MCILMCNWGSKMLKTQSIQISALHRLILVVSSVVCNFALLGLVYADEQSFIYVSDLIEGQRNINSEREIWQYQHEVSLKYQNNNISTQSRYTYPPPIMKIGSNPFSNPQRQYQLSSNKNKYNHTNVVAGNTYQYPPPEQEIGSNPFIRPKNQYVTSHNSKQFLVSSCACEKSSYQGIFASY